MLEQVLGFIHNYFEREEHRGKYSIEDGCIDLDFLQDGQYFKIGGSVFNDGVHRYGIDILEDEEFEGSIWPMAVPPALIKISDEISEWQNKYGGVDSAAMSPYQSESFGGYNYNKSGSRSGSGSFATWQDVYSGKLAQWRKI